MKGERVARNYAAALFELAEREGALEVYGEALKALADLYAEEDRFRTFLNTPRIPLPEKKKVLREALGDPVPGLVRNFALVVLDKGRQHLLPEMAQEYRALEDEHLGRAHVEVSVARELDADEIQRVKDELSRILEREAIPHVQVRPELLGGITFRSGDTIFDGSVRRRLERLRRTLMTTDVSTDQG